MEVILVKVAGVGLGIDLVGKNLREVMPLLRRLVSYHPSFLFGCSMFVGKMKDMKGSNRDRGD